MTAPQHHERQRNEEKAAALLVAVHDAAHGGDLTDLRRALAGLHPVPAERRGLLLAFSWAEVYYRDLDNPGYLTLAARLLDHGVCTDQDMTDALLSMLLRFGLERGSLDADTYDLLSTYPDWAPGLDGITRDDPP